MSDTPSEVKDADQVLALRLQLLKDGYEPIAIRSDHPDPKKRKAGVPGWRERPVTEAKLRALAVGYEQALGTGLLTGALVGADLDVTDPALLAKIEALADEHLGHSEFRRVGRKGCLLVYQIDGEPLSKITVNGAPHKVELLGEGQQFVAFGIHPDTGQPFRWTGAMSPATHPCWEVPRVAAAQVRAFAAAVQALFKAEGLGDATVEGSGSTLPSLAAGDIDLDLPHSLAWARKWVAGLAPAAEGERDDLCFRHAAVLHERAISEDVALGLLLAWNETGPVPLSDADVEKCVYSAYHGNSQNGTGALATQAPEERFAGSGALREALAASEETAEDTARAEGGTWRRAKRSSGVAPQSYTLKDLLLRTAAPVIELMAGFLVANTANMLAGPTKTRKSLYGLQTPMELVLQIAVLTSLEMPAAKGVFVSYEDDIDEVTRRVQGMCSALRVDEDHAFLENMTFKDGQVSGEPIAKVDEDGEILISPFGDSLLAELKAMPGHKIVTFDSYDNCFSFLGMAKNLPGPVNALWRWLDRLAAKDNLDCTFIVLWHPSTAGNTGSREGQVGGYSPAHETAPRVKLTMTLATEVELKAARLPTTMTAYKLFAMKRSWLADGAVAFLVYDDGLLRPASAPPAAAPLGQEGIRLAVRDVMLAVLRQGLQVTRGRGGSGWRWRQIADKVADAHPGVQLKQEQIESAWARLEAPNEATGEPAILGYRTSDRGTRRGSSAGFYVLADDPDVEEPREPITPAILWEALSQAGALKHPPHGRPPLSLNDDQLTVQLAGGDHVAAAALLPAIRGAAKLPEFSPLLAVRATGRGTNAWQIGEEW